MTDEKNGDMKERTLENDTSFPELPGKPELLQSKLAWDLLVELRKEIVGAQQVRVRVIGFKITFVSAAIGVIVARLSEADPILLVVPAFAALFFDFLVNSYSISIKRKGIYCRSYLEPKLRRASMWPKDEPLWEEYMSDPGRKQRYSLVGNLGITALAVAPALVAVFHPFRTTVSLPLLVGMLALFVYDVVSHLKPRWIAESGSLEKTQAKNVP